MEALRTGIESLEAKMDQIAREIANLRADIKDLTVEVYGRKNSMEDFRQEKTINLVDFSQEMTKMMKHFTLEMEAMFDRFERRMIITIISTSSFMLAICWGLTKLCGGN